MENNKEMMKAYNLIEKTNISFFLTGRAGTGKTSFLRRIQNKIDKSFIILAPTGVAAINAGGVTIHSFFCFEPKVLTPYDEAQLKPSHRDVLKAVDTIIIDEISMVRCDMVDAIDRALQVCMGNTLPFGGKQMLFVGDLFQLEPVVIPDDRSELSEMYGSQKPFFFNAKVFSRMQLNTIELKRVYRQSDPKFIHILDNIRYEALCTEDLEVLNDRVGKECDEDKAVITLTTTNAVARKINETMLAKMQEPEYLFEGVVTGDFDVAKFSITEKILHLRVGAQVMFTRNDTSRRWVNGTLGKVEKIEESRITVKLNDGFTHWVERATWEKVKYTYNKTTKKTEKQIVGTFTQFPLKLAWAITIHKSQGLTFDQVKIDLSGGVFAAGQTYVALSRTRSLEDIYLKKAVSTKLVKSDEQVLEFAKNFNSPDLDEETLVGEAIYDHMRKCDYDTVAGILLNNGIDKLAENDTTGASKFFSRALDYVVCDSLFFERMKSGIVHSRAIFPVRVDQDTLFVKAFIALYAKREYGKVISLCDLYSETYGKREAILYLKSRALSYKWQTQKAEKLYDEILEMLNSRKNLKVLYRSAMLCISTHPIKALKTFGQLLKSAPHAMDLHTRIRGLMQKRRLVMEPVEDPDNELCLAFNDLTLDNDSFGDLVQLHHAEGDETYKEYITTLSRQLRKLEA